MDNPFEEKRCASWSTVKVVSTMFGLTLAAEDTAPSLLPSGTTTDGPPVYHIPTIWPQAINRRAARTCNRQRFSCKIWSSCSLAYQFHSIPCSENQDVSTGHSSRAPELEQPLGRLHHVESTERLVRRIAPLRPIPLHQHGAIAALHPDAALVRCHIALAGSSVLRQRGGDVG